MESEQIPEKYLSIIDCEIENFNKRHTITEYNHIPDTTKIPLFDPTHWLKINDVICVYVDMKGSTQLSATVNADATASAYQFFTGTAVRLFREFGASYIDVRGDGAFALFNSDQPHRALASAITFKTFCKYEFTPKLKEKTDLTIGAHMGIDQKLVLVKKIGLKQIGGISDRQNEVWAGKPVNMSSKLASLSEDGELLVSERFFRNFKDVHVLKTCGCPSGEKIDVWEEVDLTNYNYFDFNKAFKLTSSWCSTHGAEYCEAIINLDQKRR